MTGNESSESEADRPSAEQDEHRIISSDQPTVSVPSPGRQEPAWRRTGAWPTAGRHFGPYQIMRRLGAGGMGEVYEAEHTESGHRVALNTTPLGCRAVMWTLPGFSRSFGLPWQWQLFGDTAGAAKRRNTLWA